MHSVVDEYIILKWVISKMILRFQELREVAIAAVHLKYMVHTLHLTDLP